MGLSVRGKRTMSPSKSGEGEPYPGNGVRRAVYDWMGGPSNTARTAGTGGTSSTAVVVVVGEAVFLCINSASWFWVLRCSSCTLLSSARRLRSSSFRCLKQTAHVVMAIIRPNRHSAQGTSLAWVRISPTN